MYLVSTAALNLSPSDATVYSVSVSRSSPLLRQFHSCTVTTPALVDTRAVVVSQPRRTAASTSSASSAPTGWRPLANPMAAIRQPATTNITPAPIKAYFLIEVPP